MCDGCPCELGGWSLAGPDGWGTAARRSISLVPPELSSSTDRVPQRPATSTYTRRAPLPLSLFLSLPLGCRRLRCSAVSRGRRARVWWARQLDLSPPPRPRPLLRPRPHSSRRRAYNRPTSRQRSCLGSTRGPWTRRCPSGICSLQRESRSAQVRAHLPPPSPPGCCHHPWPLLAGRSILGTDSASLVILQAVAVDFHNSMLERLALNAASELDSLVFRADGPSLPTSAELTMPSPSVSLSSVGSRERLCARCCQEDGPSLCARHPVCGPERLGQVLAHPRTQDVRGSMPAAQQQLLHGNTRKYRSLGITLSHLFV